MKPQPGSTVDTVRDFARVEVHSKYPFTYGFGALTTKLPLSVRRPLGKAIGWHLMITAVR
jgi:hypothetical protein